MRQKITQAALTPLLYFCRWIEHLLRYDNAEEYNAILMRFRDNYEIILILIK